MNAAPDRPGEYIDFEGMKAAAKAEYEVTQKALDDLHEEARRARVPPVKLPKRGGRRSDASWWIGTGVLERALCSLCPSVRRTICECDARR